MGFARRDLPLATLEFNQQHFLQILQHSQNAVLSQLSLAVDQIIDDTGISALRTAPMGVKVTICNASIYA